MNGRTPPGVEIVSRSYRLPLELDEYLKAEGARRYGSAQGILIEAIMEHRKLRGIVDAAIPAVDPRQLELPVAVKKAAAKKPKKHAKPAKKGAKR